jgi:hypothetical protein
MVKRLRGPGRPPRRYSEAPQQELINVPLRGEPIMSSPVRQTRIPPPAIVNPRRYLAPVLKGVPVK